MTKSKTIAAALAALTLATTFTAIGGQAQAGPPHAACKKRPATDLGFTRDQQS